MPRQGRFLEILVKQLEQLLAPQGVKVQSPEIFYGSNGRKIGEIDVTLRGNFGSSTVFIGIECRDRPGGGSQGDPWINEIFGKKRLLNVDKMIAVSTTGFTQEAIIAAEELKIDLLVIENADKFDLSDWFTAVNFVYQDTHFELLSGGVFKSVQKNGEILKVSIEKDKPCLEFSPNENLLSIEEFIERELESIIDELPLMPNVPLQIQLDVDEQFNLVLDENRIPIAKMTLPLHVWRDVISAKMLLNAYKRPDKNNIIAMAGVCDVQTRHKKLKALLLVKKNLEDDSLKDFKLSFVTDDYEPHIIRAGSRLTISEIKPAKS